MAGIIEQFTKKLEDWGVNSHSLTRGTFIFAGIAGTYTIFL